MKALNGAMAVVVGAASGGALFFFIALACSATIGSPNDVGAAITIGYVMVLLGAICGGVVVFLIWRKIGPTNQPPPV